MLYSNCLLHCPCSPWYWRHYANFNDHLQLWICINFINYANLKSRRFKCNQKLYVSKTVTIHNLTLLDLYNMSKIHYNQGFTDFKMSIHCQFSKQLHTYWHVCLDNSFRLFYLSQYFGERRVLTCFLVVSYRPSLTY